MASKKNRPAYVYKLVNPLTSEPFYIGVTINLKQRHITHSCAPKTPTGKMLKEKGIKPLFIIIEECLMKDASKRESYWLKKHSQFIENKVFNSSYSIKIGRKPLKDKKELLRLYLKESDIDKMGGEGKLIKTIYDFIEREVNNYKI